jgi:hypothetical protein
MVKSSLELLQEYRNIITESMVQVKSKPFASKEEAEIEMDKYYGDYNSWGYSTSLSLEELPGGSWIYKGTRYDSCD